MGDIMNELYDALMITIGVVGLSIILKRNELMQQISVI